MDEKFVAILFEPEGTWSLSAIEGIADYLRRHTRWRLLCAPRDRHGRIGIPPGWRGEGIFTRLLTDQDRKRCLSYDLPIVDLEAIVEGKYDHRLARVKTNNQTRAALIVDHLLERNLRQFAIFNPPHREYSQERLQAVQDRFQQQGFQCTKFWTAAVEDWHDLNWQKQQQFIKSWAGSLPTGTGVVTPDGRQGRLLCEWCEFLGIEIPDHLSVITCDDDGLLCAISSPPLTGVVLASKQHGYAAAELLDQMMNGAPAPEEPILIDPLHVMVRQSTDHVALGNQDIVRAIRYIQENACLGIQVTDVARHLLVSRRWLEKQFQAVVGHTLGYEIRKARMDRVRSHLAGTDLSVEQIAAICGFSTGARLCRSFRSLCGETPLHYRRRCRP